MNSCSRTPNRCTAVSSARVSMRSSAAHNTPDGRSPFAAASANAHAVAAALVPTNSAAPPTIVTRAPSASVPRTSTRTAPTPPSAMRWREHRQAGGEAIASVGRLTTGETPDVGENGGEQNRGGQLGAITVVGADGFGEPSRARDRSRNGDSRGPRRAGRSSTRTAPGGAHGHMPDRPFRARRDGSRRIPPTGRQDGGRAGRSGPATGPPRRRAGRRDRGRRRRGPTSGGCRRGHLRTRRRGSPPPRGRRRGRRGGRGWASTTTSCWAGSTRPSRVSSMVTRASGSSRDIRLAMRPPTTRCQRGERDGHQFSFMSSGRHPPCWGGVPPVPRIRRVAAMAPPE